MHSLALPGLDDLTTVDVPEDDAGMDAEAVKALGQYATPVWVAEALMARYFPTLDSGDCVLEPSCGEGHFLQAIPAHVPAFGVEIDPVKAEAARQRTGRKVLTGDFRTVALDMMPTAIIGNPPFELDVIDGFLERAYALLPHGGRCGLLLPAYMFQTAKRVVGYARRWSLAQEMIPRNIFPGLSKPLAFVMFSKDSRRALVGFALYHEADSVLRLKAKAREILSRARSSTSVWREVVDAALAELGGAADVASVCAAVEGRRPTDNQWHREKIRQTLGRYFVRVAEGRYSRPQHVLGVA